MLFAPFQDWLNNLQQQALLKNHRVLVVIAGDNDWVRTLIESTQSSVESFSTSGNSLVYSNYVGVLGNVNKVNYRHQLGTESQSIIFADSDFNIDALAALSGTLVAGGILLIAFDQPLSVIKKQQSLFLTRFITKINRAFSTAIVEQGEESHCLSYKNGALAQNTDNSYCNINMSAEFLAKKFSQTKEKEKAELGFGCATYEQYQAVKSIIKVSSGHRNRPLVLTADRGRGKTCALALACAEIVSSVHQPIHIIITAAHVRALNNFFSQLKQRIPLANHLGNKVTLDGSVIEYYPVDQLIQHKHKAHLLLVDEAAAIPVYILKEILLSYHRSVFSTTIHGYEGAGRGFSLKFEAIIARHFTHWKKIHIAEPIRWSVNDPVEQFIFDVCLLNAALPKFDENFKQEEVLQNHVNQALAQFEVSNENAFFEVKEISQQQLLSDEALLSQLFAVLVTAHYQTTPSDLKLLLDHPKINVLAIFYQKKILAVSLLMEEGLCSHDDVQAVKTSQRRLRDQFLPQSLFSHCGFESAFTLSYLRIMRIAVHPSYQNKGLGTFLLKHIELFARAKGIDFLGTSFGCNPQLLNFWLNEAFVIARIGFTKDAASGEHSSLVIKGLTTKLQHIQSDLTASFYQAFVYLLADEYQFLPDRLVHQILRYYPIENLPTLSKQDISAVKSFANKERLFSSCAFSLHLWLLHQCCQQQQDEYQEAILLAISRLFKRLPVEKVIETYQLSGKKSLNQLLVNYVDKQIKK